MNSVKGTMPGLTVLLAGLFFGTFANAVVHPSAFSTGAVTHPNGIVATPTVFLVSSQDQYSDSPGSLNSLIYSLNAAGAVIAGTGHNGAWVTITHATEQAGLVQEVYLAAAPGVGGDWTAFDIYACRGNKVFKIPAAGGIVDGTAPFATLTGASDRQHCGITFDRTGTFSFDMIVTTEGDDGTPGAGGSIGGGIYVVTSAGGPTAIAKQLPFATGTSSTNITEGPAVAPIGFQNASGQLLFTQEDNPGPPGTSGTVFQLTSGGTVAAYTTLLEPESVHIVPPTVCDYSTTGGGFFTTDFFNNAIIKYPASDFSSIHGDALVPIEFTSAGNNIKDINHTTGVVSDFDASDTSPAIVHEGSIFVECGPATMPIVKHSTNGAIAPTNSDFIFGLYPRGDANFTADPTGSTNTLLGSVFFNYVVNAADGSVSCAAVPAPFNGTSVRGTCVLTPPENNLSIPLDKGLFFTAVCELKHTAGWNFSSWTVTFTPNNIAGNFVSAPFNPTGETVDPQIACVNLTIQPGTTEVDLDIYDAPPETSQVCTPGYWKQSQHFFAWPAGVLPNTTLFGSIFNTSGRKLGNPENQNTLFSGITLLKALQLKGGGLNAVARLGTGAWLDSKTINFSLSTATVVQMVNAAFAANDANVLFNGKGVLNTFSDIMNSEDLGLAVCPLGIGPLN